MSSFSRSRCIFGRSVCAFFLMFFDDFSGPDSSMALQNLRVSPPPLLPPLRGPDLHVSLPKNKFFIMFFFAARHANRKTMKKRSGNFVRERVFARFWSRVGLELGFLLMKEERNQDIELERERERNWREERALSPPSAR